MKSNKVYWDRVLEDYKVSGLSKKEFCRVFDLPYNALLMYECRQRKKKPVSASASSPGFLKLEILPEGEHL